MKEPILNIGAMHKECAEARQKDWQEKNKNLIIAVGDFIKMPFISKGEKKETEHMWVEVKECSKDQKTFKGTLSNDPIVCTHLRDGSSVEFKRTEIEQLMKHE